MFPTVTKFLGFRSSMSSAPRSGQNLIRQAFQLTFESWELSAVPDSADESDTKTVWVKDAGGMGWTKTVYVNGVAVMTVISLGLSSESI